MATSCRWAPISDGVQGHCTVFSGRCTVGGGCCHPADLVRRPDQPAPETLVVAHPVGLDVKRAGHRVHEEGHIGSGHGARHVGESLDGPRNLMVRSPPSRSSLVGRSPSCTQAAVGTTAPARQGRQLARVEAPGRSDADGPGCRRVACCRRPRPTPTRPSRTRHLRDRRRRRRGGGTCAATGDRGRSDPSAVCSTPLSSLSIIWPSTTCPSPARLADDTSVFLLDFRAPAFAPPIGKVTGVWSRIPSIVADLRSSSVWEHSATAEYAEPHPGRPPRDGSHHALCRRRGTDPRRHDRPHLSGQGRKGPTRPAGLPALRRSRRFGHRRPFHPSYWSRAWPPCGTPISRPTPTGTSGSVPQKYPAAMKGPTPLRSQTDGLVLRPYLHRDHPTPYPLVAEQGSATNNRSPGTPPTALRPRSLIRLHPVPSLMPGYVPRPRGATQRRLPSERLPCTTSPSSTPTAFPSASPVRYPTRRTTASSSIWGPVRPLVRRRPRLSHDARPPRGLHRPGEPDLRRPCGHRGESTAGTRVRRPTARRPCSRRLEHRRQPGPVGHRLPAQRASSLTTAGAGAAAPVPTGARGAASFRSR